MPDASTFLLFAAASLAFLAIPGPSVFYIVTRSLAQGRRAGVTSMLGVQAGGLVHVVAAAFGVSAIIASSATAFTIVKYVGAAYLVLLGVQAVRHRDASTADEVAVARGTARIVRDGFVVGVTNPKSMVFLAAVLPQFVHHDGGSIPVQMVLLGLIFVLVAFSTDSTYAWAAGTARTWFGGEPRRLTRMQAGGGLMMIGLGGTLALTGQK